MTRKKLWNICETIVLWRDWTSLEPIMGIIGRNLRDHYGAIGIAISATGTSKCRSKTGL